MSNNPYESPRDAENACIVTADALRWPAVAVLVTSVLAVLGTIVGAVGAVLLLKMATDLEIPELGGDAFELFVASGLWFVFGVAGFVVARGMRRRQLRWVIIAWSIVAVLTFVLAPLGVILLMRLWRQDVWESFNHPA